MKVILVNPPITLTERYGMDIGDIGGHQAPLGLCYLAAFLEQRGFSVKLIDAEAEKLSNNEVIKRIGYFKPAAVGVTSTTTAFHRARDLADDIKLFDPDITTIIGGPHITANPEKTLSFKCFDYGVMREGEITLFNLLEALKNNEAIRGIEGIVYRKGGDAIINPPRPYIDDLNSLPFPARHLLPDIKKYIPPLGSYSRTPVISMITSRGCPYGCIFCDNNVFGGNIRYHSPEYVVSEIKNVTGNYGAKEIFFLDDTFIIDEERVREIMFLMRKDKVKIKWTCMTRVDNMTKDLFREMKASGCWQISIGTESGNQEILKFIKKGIELEQVRNVVKWSDEAGIYVKGFFMIGHPLETTETIDETINFAKSVPFTDIVTTIATPIPGTKLYSLASEYGVFHDDDWVNFSYWKPVFVPRGLTEKTLYSTQKKIYKEFYFRFNIIIRQIKKIRSLSQFTKYIINLPKLIPLLIYWDMG